MVISETTRTKGAIEVYGVVQGPHTRPDMEDGDYCMIVVSVIDGDMYYDHELYSTDFNWLYEIQKFCLGNIEPYVIKDENIE